MDLLKERLTTALSKHPMLSDYLKYKNFNNDLTIESYIKSFSNDELEELGTNSEKLREDILSIMRRLDQESKLQVFKSTSLLNIKKYNDEWIATLEEKNGKKVQVNAKIVIDATELGDIAKLCGVGYDIGMESKYITNEDVAPDSANKDRKSVV